MLEHNYKSVCLFPPDGKDAPEAIQIVNFVYEPHPAACKDAEIRNYYTAHIIASGECEYSTDYKTQPLKAGDVFFTFPGKRYAYTNPQKLKLIYIGFTGCGALQLLDRLEIRYTDSVRKGAQSIIPLIRREFSISEKNKSAELTAKGLLFLICSRFNRGADSIGAETKIDVAKTFIDYIETHYREETLSLKDMAKTNYYNFNYAAQLFKRHTGVTFSRYVTDLRLRKAQTLLAETDLSVTAIALKVGFSDDKYFTRVFKKIKGLTPSQYRKNAKK